MILLGKKMLKNGKSEEGMLGWFFFLFQRL